MSQRDFALLFLVLLAFMIAWSTGLAKPVIDLVDPATQYGNYIINKGILAAVMALALWRLKAFRAVGYGPGMGLASYLIALPLLALGVFSLLEPGRATLTPFEITGWAVAILFIAFTEETLFRGILWKALEEASLWRRAIITSLIFGLIHTIPAGFAGYGWGIGIVYGLSAGAFGMVFAAIRERAGSIWSVVITHVVFDIAAISAAGNVDALLDPGLETYKRFLTSAVVFTAWGSGAIYLLNRRAAKKGPAQHLRRADDTAVMGT
jgi:membrane protease YdiL (CAAX protease family)